MKTSAGILMYKFGKKNLKVFLVHPGGPFWQNKDRGTWGIPKGEADDGEEGERLLNVAKREFLEETGINPEDKKFINLGFIKQKNGKIVHAWAFENNWEGRINCSSYVETIYDGRKIRFPEVNKGEFFDLKQSKQKILPSQHELIERLVKHVGSYKPDKTLSNFY